MGESGTRRGLAVFLLLLFVISTQSYYFSNQKTILDDSDEDVTEVLGQAQKIAIGSYPYGAVEKVRISVPDGQVVQSMNIDIAAADLATSTAYSFTDSQDFASSTAFEGVDVNSSSLSLLPQEWSWDFESGNFGPEWRLGGVSNWYIQSSNVIGGSQTAQAGSISANQETSLSLDVSSLPAGSGTFRYQVSSESGFDYLIFCIDNTGCSRSSGYNQRWAGITSGTHTFNIPATANSLTWKYTKDGSVNSGQDTAWIDDLVITPTGGAGNGEGSWTSPAFGPELSGQGEPRNYGLMYMDAYVPIDSDFEWSLLDASTDSVIPGFDGLTDTYMDFGIIDWLSYPLVKMRIDMSTTTGSLPVVHGIHFDGLIQDDFDSNPSFSGWQLNGVAWNPGSISGSGTIQSPEYFIRSGFVGVKSNSYLNGSATLYYSIDSGQNWNSLPNDNLQSFGVPYFSVMFKAVSNGGNWVFDRLSVEMIRTSVVDGLELDIGLDGISDWTMDRTGIGRLGVQDLLTDDSLWGSEQSSPSSPAEFSVFIPTQGIEKFEFAVASPSVNFINPYMTLSHNNQDILTSSFNDFSKITTVRLTQSQISTINDAIDQSVTGVNINGLQFAEIKIKIGSSSTNSLIQFGGLIATYDSSVNLDFIGSDGLIIGLNSILPSAPMVNGYRDISIPVRMKSTGAILMTVNSITTAPSVNPISMEVSNVTDTFTPSMNWIDVTSSFDFSGIGVNNPENFVKGGSWLVDFNLVGENNIAQLRCSTLALPVVGNGVSNCVQNGVQLIWSDLGTNGGISMAGTSSTLEFHHRFKFPVEWDDEEFLLASVNMVSQNGPMLSVSKSFGLGNSQGVENDIALKHWTVVGPNGIPTDNQYPYLPSQRGEPVIIQAHLGFEGDEGTAPRTGHALVRLLVNGNEYGSTSVINEGIASIPWVTPVVGETVELEIDIQPLRGQEVSYEVQNNILFRYDAVNPQLLSMNIDEFDHFQSSPSTMLEFTITDRPVLPTQSKIVIWKSWENDFDQDGQIDISEVLHSNLKQPDDLTMLEGIYQFDLDTSSAPDGGYVQGWLEVADSAGNMLTESGNLTHPLFNLLISSDGSPQLGYSELSWEYGLIPWLHPGEAITLSIPVWDKNGVTDITDIELDLSVNQPDSSTISWNRQTNVCSSSTLYIQIDSCEMIGDSGSGLFTNSGEFVIKFELKWGFDPDDSITRTPLIRLTDLNRQSTTIELSDLNWKYSGEMEINKHSLSYSTSGNNDSTIGSWVKAREDITLSGSLNWVKTQRQVLQDLELLITLGLNQAPVDYMGGMFNGTIVSPATPGNYPIDVALRNPPNGATIIEPNSPLLWFIVDDEAPSIKSIDYPLPAQIIEESEWDFLEILMTLSENSFMDQSSLSIKWEIHPSGFGFASSSIANGSGLISILGGMPYGESIIGAYGINVASVVPEEIRTDALELRIWVSGSDMAGNQFGSVSDEVYTPLAVWQLEQQLPEYSLEQPRIIYSGGLEVGKAIDLSVVIQNVGKSDGDAQLRVERVESNGARTIIHSQQVKVNSGSIGEFNHRWTPDRAGSMWIEFIIIGGPSKQTDTFYVDSGESDGFLGGIAEINPVLLIVILLLVASLIGLLIFGLRSPKGPQGQRLPANKNYQLANRQIRANQTHHYAQQQVPSSPGDNPYK
ncbi:MAG: hypothetical protein VXZ52_00655 [Candidatus Thermoplasmatota archaeon]|nr:hypothetical protein [Candidatus Thermoplasmatota archaeon]